MTKSKLVMFLEACLQLTTTVLRASLVLIVIVCSVVSTAGGQQGAPAAGENLSARDQAQAYFENDEARKAVATLAEAARLKPEDRVIGAMLFSGIRDHVWHIEQTLPIAHDAAVRVLAFSPAGDKLATGAASGLVVVSTTEALDEDEAKARRVEFKHEGAVIGAFFSSDGKRLAVASSSGGLKVWELEGRGVVFEAPNPGSPITAFMANRAAQLVAIGTEDGTLQVLDVAAAKLLDVQPDKAGAKIVDLALSPDGTRLGAAASNRTAQVWSVASGKTIGAPIQYGGEITSIDFSRDGRYLLIASTDKTATLSDPDSGVAVMPVMACTAGIKKARISPDGARIATMLDDGSVQFWDAFTGEQLQLDVREDGQFNDLSWSRTGLRIATASEGNHASMWSTRDGTRWGESLPHDAPVLTVEYSDDGKLLATSSANGTVRLWRMDGGKGMPTVRSHSARARAAFYSLDGDHVITTSEDHTALHWISGQVRPQGRPLKHRGKVTCGTFNKEATRILTSDDTGAAQLWIAETNQPDGPPFMHKRPVNWVDFHPDGKRFVAASGTGASVWSVDNRARPLTMITHQGKGKSEIKCARFSPDGKWLVTASTDGTAQLWDASTYKSVAKPINRGFSVLCVRFSPDGSRLVVAGEDAQAAVYETGTWQPIGTPVLMPGPVFSAAFTEDNLFLVVSAFLLNAVQFFEVETGRAVGNGPGVPSQATCVDYHLRDKVVIVACDDGTARALGTPFIGQDVPAWACAFAERMAGYRKTGPDSFERVNSHFGHLATYVSGAAQATNADFPRLVRWKMTTGAERTGLPRFTSTLAANIVQRVEERSVDALYECYEAAPVEPLVLAALSVYLANGRQSEFLADLVLARKDAQPLARAFTGTALVNAGRSDEARKVMAEAAAAAPDDHRVLRRQAKLSARLMDKELAVQQFEKSLALDPDDFETRRSYAWALYNLHETQKAAAQFQLAQELTGDFNSDIVAGVCLCAAALKNTNEARSAFRRLVAIDPAWKEAAYIGSLSGWTQHELRELEIIRSALFPVRTSKR